MITNLKKQSEQMRRQRVIVRTIDNPAGIVGKVNKIDTDFLKLDTDFQGDVEFINWKKILSIAPD